MLRYTTDRSRPCTHPARKRRGSILTTPQPARVPGHTNYLYKIIFSLNVCIVCALASVLNIRNKTYYSVKCSVFPGMHFPCLHEVLHSDVLTPEAPLLQHEIGKCSVHQNSNRAKVNNNCYNITYYIKILAHAHTEQYYYYNYSCLKFYRPVSKKPS